MEPKLSSRERRDRQYAAGFCTIPCCKNVYAVDRRLCSEHLEKARKSAKKVAKALKAAGICGWVGCPSARDGDHVYCAPHLARMRNYSAARSASRLAAGLCRDCPNSVSGTVRCGECRAKINAATPRVRCCKGAHFVYDHSRLGFCNYKTNRCPEEAFRMERKCEKHYLREAAKAAKRQAAMRRLVLANGNCPRCKQRPLAKNRSRCQPCLDYAAAWIAARTAAQKAAKKSLDFARDVA